MAEFNNNIYHSNLRVAVLISGGGSNLQALIDAIASQQLPGVEIALVISNRANAYGLQRPLTHKLPTAFIPWRPCYTSFGQIWLCWPAGCAS